MNWTTQIPSLRNVLAKHFPDTSAEQIEGFAEEIYDNSSPARFLQWMERNDLEPSTDIENVRAASKLLRDAAGKIEKLGWHGGQSVRHYAGKLWGQENQISSMPVLSDEALIKVLAGKLTQMSDDLAGCADTIDPNAASSMTALGNDESSGRPRGKPPETHAHFTARAVYAVFEKITGKKPSVTTNPYLYGNPASGPFLEFVKDVFETLEIKASPETWARKVCKENNTRQK